VNGSFLPLAAVQIRVFRRSRMSGIGETRHSTQADSDPIQIAVMNGLRVSLKHPKAADQLELAAMTATDP